MKPGTAARAVRACAAPETKEGAEITIIICCACGLLGFALGLLAGRPARRAQRRPPEPETPVRIQPDDALSRDIAALLAYTGPRKEEPREDG